jgi:Holliday junction resolvasome RuvABC endonuclease subunit
MRVLGVDPGAVSGAYALVTSMQNAIVLPTVDDIPIVDRQVNAAEWSRIVKQLKPDVAVVEQVGSMPKQGVASTFKFGMGCGLIRGVLAGAGVPIISVTPAKWKRHFSLNSDAEKSRALAIRRFPTAPLGRKKDHGRAEALLLALWKIETDDPV